MVNSNESIREKNELNRKMDGKHEHGFHFTKEGTNGNRKSITYAHTHQVYVLNVINNQRTANKHKNVTPCNPSFVFPYPEKQN